MINGANIGTTTDDFFQSDRDIEINQTKLLKQTKYKNNGNPTSLSSKILDFQINPFNTTLLFTAESGFVSRKLDLKSGKTLSLFKGHTGPVTKVLVIYSSSGHDEFIITSSWDKTARKWSTKTGQTELIFNGHADFVKAIAIFGNFLYTGSSDSLIKKWDIVTGKELATLKGHTRGVEDLAIDYETQILYSCSSDTTIRKWDVNTNALLGIFDGHLTSVYSINLVDGNLWSTSADNTAKRWDLETGMADITLEHPDFVRCVQIVGSYALTGCRDQNIRVWDLAKDEKCTHVYQGHFDEVSSIHAVDSNKFLSASLDGTVREWKLSDVGSVEEDTVVVEAAVVVENVIKKGKEKGKVEMTADEEAELAELMDL